VRLHDGIILQQVLDFGSFSADRLTARVESLRYVLLRGNTAGQTKEYLNEEDALGRAARRRDLRLGKCR
jgi:hypothetical protein